MPELTIFGHLRHGQEPTSLKKPRPGCGDLHRGGGCLWPKPALAPRVVPSPRVPSLADGATDGDSPRAAIAWDDSFSIC